MLNITVDNNTDLDELDLIGNFLKELSKLRFKREIKLSEAEPETTKAPKKTKAQPVILTTPEVLEAKKPEPVQEPEPEVVEAPEPEVTEPAVADPVLDLVGLRAALAPIIKDKKDALTELVKSYGDSLPKIDPALYPEILAKAKEL